MISLSGYEYVGELQGSFQCKNSLYKRLSDGTQVVLKFPDSDNPPSHVITELEHEYFILKQLHSDKIVHAYDLIQTTSVPILVLEDVGNTNLKKYINSKALPLNEFFIIALQLSQLLIEMHKKHITHKDIKPSNIIIDRKTLKIKLIDFRIASQLSEEVQETTQVDLLQGTLAYMSPEQTGRMNLPVDYRTDYYSLGVTFFEMLTGQLPFYEKDPLDLVYSHIAKPTPKVKDINPDVPTMLSKLVYKLMRKSPENRYALAFQLFNDLQNSAKQWKDTGQIKDFILGENDISAELHIPHKLYGREQQIDFLKDKLQQLETGNSSFTIISGYSGIGKSSLVNEMRKYLKEGYFVTSKYDLLQRSKPYSAIIPAFESVIKQILTEPRSKLERIKKDLLNHLRNNGQIIINLIPELELIIGPQPPVPELPSKQAENRFKFIFQEFVAALATEEHPLVMFLDDLQWADYSSLQLIVSFLTNSSIEHLMLIGAYRDNEVELGHPLLESLNQLRDAYYKYDEIHLAPLGVKDIQKLLIDTFKKKVTDVRDLAELIHSKTEGNPFFIHEFLMRLYKNKSIKLLHEKGEWDWDIKAIAEETTTENVVEMLVDRINELDPATQEILKYAACLGHEFDIKTLVIITQKPIKDVATHLLQAQEMNLIIPFGDTSKLIALLANGYLSETELEKFHYYRFAHDRIQQAAYKLISPEDVANMQLIIGRLLLNENPKLENNKNLFAVMDHFLNAKQLIKDPDEQYIISKDFLMAGKIANDSGAHKESNTYIQAGIELLPNDSWSKNYDLTFSLYYEQMECLYLLHEYEEGDKIFELLLTKAATDIDKANVCLIKIRIYGMIDLHREALKTAVRALGYLNFKLPKHATIVSILKEIIYINRNTAKKNMQELDELMQPLKDRHMQMILRLLNSIIPSTYFIDINLYAYLICKIVNLSLKHGYTEETSTACFGYSFLLFHVLKQPTRAFEFMTLGQKIEDRITTPQIESINHFIKAFGLTHLMKNPKAELPFLRESITKAMEVGNVEYATYSRTVEFTRFHVSEPLSAVLTSSKQALKFMLSIKNLSWYRHYVMLVNIIEVLMGKEVSQNSFDDLWADIVNDSPSMRSGSYAEFSELNYFLGNYAVALDYGNKFFNEKEFNTGFIGNIYGWWFHGLAIIKAYPQASMLLKIKYQYVLRSIRKELRYFAKLYPPNYKFMSLFFEAELNSLKNKKFATVASLYTQAIEAAVENGYFNYASLINENAANYYIQQHQLPLVKNHIQQSYLGYERWGALYKCKQLAEKFPVYIEELVNRMRGENITAESSSNISAQTFDLKAVMNSTKTISSEIKLETLLNKLLQIMIEDSGAQRGVLLFERDKQLYVVAEGDNKAINVDLTGSNLEEVNNLPKSILSYVQRTKENIILNNKEQMAEYAKEPYLHSKNGPQSLLAMPILQKGNAVGFVLLENRLISNAFTKERINILNVLAGQAAISLENAEIYAASSRFVPYQLLQQLHRKNINEVRLGDQIQQTMTILFCDIRGFTTLSEQLNPSEIFSLINIILSHMSPIIKKHNGFIDKYIGDAIMALFTSADDAVEAALNMLNELEVVNKAIEGKFSFKINVGIGINTGELMMGVIGDSERMEGTVLGDAVNIASRIQNLTKEYNHPLLISENTLSDLQHSYDLNRVGKVQVKGKSNSLVIWSVTKKKV